MRRDTEGRFQQDNYREKSRCPLSTSGFCFPLPDPDGLNWMQAAELLEAVYYLVLNCHLCRTKKGISVVRSAVEWHVAFDLLGMNPCH